MRKDGYTPEMVQFLKDNYGKIPIKDIALKFKKTESAIHNKVSKLKISKSNEQHWEEINRNIPDMKRDYESGMSFKDLQNKYHHYAGNIRKALYENGVKIKEKYAGTPKYKINARYFKHIDTPKKAYWLGFIWGDGNICNGTLQIGLHRKDRVLIEEFLEDIGSNHKIYSDRGNPKICIKVKVLYQDLLNCGMYPNKSLSIGPPEEDVLPEELVKYFILGLIDADGCYGLSPKKDKCQSVSIIGTKLLISWVKEYFDKLGFSTNMYVEKRLEHNLIWTLYVSLPLKDQKNDNFRNHFYGDHNFGLKRKRDRVFL